MNETNLIEAAAEAAAGIEQKETKDTKAEENGAEQADASAGAQERVEKPAEVLPESVGQGREGVVRREHPAGEVFFRGSAEEVTDAEAEEIARKQLARSGLLRGQRVRVGD